MRDKREIVLESPLQPAEVLTRLQEQSEQERLSMWLRIRPYWKPIVVRIRGNRVRVRQHRNYQNSFGPLFHGELVATDKGTRLTGRFRVHPLVRGFSVFWFGGLTVFAVAAVLDPAEDGLVMLAIAGFMVLFASGLVYVGWQLGANERHEIIGRIDEVMRTP